MLLESHEREELQRFININEHTNCWDWNGSLNESGIPVFLFQGKLTRVRRFIYRLYYDTRVADTEETVNSCGNNGCVNPIHIQLHSIRLSQTSMQENYPDSDKTGQDPEDSNTDCR